MSNEQEREKEPKAHSSLLIAHCSPRHAAQSDVGRVRSNNEDRWFADPRAGFYLVADGMGGRMAGDLASRAVVEVLPAQLRKAVGGQRPEVGGQRSEIRPPNSDLRSPLTAAAVERVREAVAGLSRTMHRESAGQPGLAGMGATLVLAIVRAGRALVTLRLSHPGQAKVFALKMTGERNGEIPAQAGEDTLAIPVSVAANGEARMCYEIAVGPR